MQKTSRSALGVQSKHRHLVVKSTDGVKKRQSTPPKPGKRYCAWRIAAWRRLGL